MIGIILMSKLISSPLSCSPNESDQYAKIIISLFAGLISSIFIATISGTSLSATIALVFSTAGVHFLSGELIVSWFFKVLISWVFLGSLSIILTIVFRILISYLLNLSRKNIIKILVSYRISSVIFYLIIASLLAGNNIGFLSSLTCHKAQLYMIFSPIALLIFLIRYEMYRNIYEKILVTISRHFSITLTTLIILSMANVMGIPIPYTYIIVLSYSSAILIGPSIGAQEVIKKIMFNWIYSIAIGFSITLVFYYILNILL